MDFNWKVWALIIIIIAILLLSLVRNKKCKIEGNKLGVPFRCKFFDCEPITLIAEEHYYGKRDGKCYEITDYGSNMSFREISMANCETQKERKTRIEKSNIAEVEYL